MPNLKGQSHPGQIPLFVKSASFLALLIPALYVVGSTVYTSLHYLFPSLYMDQWEYMISFISYESVNQLSQWWFALHNEHQIIFPRLLFLMDWKLFGGKNDFLIIWILLNQALLGYLLWGIIKSIQSLNRYQKYSLFCSILILLFSAVQIENFTWGFQVQFVNVYMFALLSFLFANRYLSERSLFDYLGMLVFAVLASYSMVNGLLVWPILILFFLIYKRRWWDLSVLFALSIAVITFYLSKSEGSSHLIDRLADPLAISQYFLVYLGNPWGHLSYTIAQIWAVLLLAILSFSFVWVIRNKQNTQGFGVLVLGCLFILATAGVTALGRMHEGLISAIEQRYSTPVLILNALVLIMLVQVTVRQDGERIFRKVTQGAFIFFALLISYLAYVQLSYIQNYISHFRERQMALNALQNDSYDKYYADALHPRLQFHAMRTFRVMEQDAVLSKLHNYQDPELNSLSILPAQNPVTGEGYLLRNDSVGRDASTWIICGMLDLVELGSDRFLHIKDSSNKWVGSGYLVEHLPKVWPFSDIHKEAHQQYFYGHIGIYDRADAYHIYLETKEGLVPLLTIDWPNYLPQLHGIQFYSNQRPAMDWQLSDKSRFSIDNLPDTLAHSAGLRGVTTWSKDAHTGIIELSIEVPSGASVLQFPYRSGSIRPDAQLRIWLNENENIYQQSSLPAQSEHWALFDIEVPDQAQSMRIQIDEQGSQIEQWIALGAPAWW